MSLDFEALRAGVAQAVPYKRGDGAVRFPVAVRPSDAQDHLVAQMTVDWHIRRRAPG